MRFIRVLVTLSLTFGATLATASVASAHDELVTTTPAAGSTIEAGATLASITFSEKVLQLGENKGIALEIKAPDGSLVTNGCVTVTGAAISTPIDIDQAGEYSVSWQSVSEDGHPNSGAFKFAVTNDAGYVSSGVPPCPQLLIAPAPKPSEGKPVDNKGESAQPFLVAVVVVVLILLGGFIVRRRLAKAKSDG